MRDHKSTQDSRRNIDTRSVIEVAYEVRHGMRYKLLQKHGQEHRGQTDGHTVHTYTSEQAIEFKAR